ncbi:hypothetical protein N0V90_012828 [Kalmusia sp. IMI 367209]|nr:hypothetical protein N0V90_012828 [Kalmusia sp. IMI 367209]
MAAASPTRRSRRDRSSPKKDAMSTQEVAVATRRKGRQGQLEEADVDIQRSAAKAFSEGAPSFPAPASSLRSLSPPKRKTASSKADLAYLNPNIEFLPLRNTEETGISLPASVTELWSRCEKRQLDSLTTDPPVLLTDNDHRIIDDTLSDAFEQAEKWRDTTTEPHWISVVVGPILHLLRRIVCFKNSAVPNAKIAVLDVTPTEISPAELGRNGQQVGIGRRRRRFQVAVDKDACFAKKDTAVLHSSWRNPTYKASLLFDPIEETAYYNNEEEEVDAGVVLDRVNTVFQGTQLCKGFFFRDNLNYLVERNSALFDLF